MYVYYKTITKLHKGNKTITKLQQGNKTVTTLHQYHVHKLGNACCMIIFRVRGLVDVDAI
jgi:hypothetical protein